MSATASPTRAEARAWGSGPAIRAVLTLLVAAWPGASFAQTRGRVIHATAGRAYVDRGALEGIQVGQTLSLVRRGHPAKTAARCTVFAVSDHRATCDARSARAGDTFTVQPPAAPPGRPLAVLPPPPAPAELARRRRALERAPAPLLEHRGSAGTAPLAALRTELSLGHGSWASVAASGGPFHGEQLDATVLGAPLPWGTRLFVDATAVQWTRRASTTRQPRGPSQLYVRRFELSRRGLEPGLTFSLGRLWAAHAPGMGVFDGVQAGYGDPVAGWEVGVLAGASPNTLTTMPELGAPLLGAYASHTVMTPIGPILRLQDEARVTFGFGAATGRGEVEASSRVWLPGNADVFAGARLGFGAGASLLQLAQLDTTLRPGGGLRFGAGVRYADLTGVPLAADMRYAGRTLHADGTLAWDAADWISIGAGAAYARELDDALWRTEAGPELRLPRLFGSTGGLSAGYRYGFGWLGGHAAYLQSSWAPLRPLRLLARVSYFSARSDPALPLPEAGLYLAVDYALTGWLRLRASALGKLPVDVVGWPDEQAHPNQASLNAQAGLGASF